MMPSIWTPEPRSVIPPDLRSPIFPGERGWDEAWQVYGLINTGLVNDGHAMVNAGIIRAGSAGGDTPPTPPIAGYSLYTFSANGFQSNAGTTAIANDGDVVGYWTDFSGNGNHLKSAADNNTRPTLKLTQINGHASIRFDGANDLLTCSPALSAPYTIFTVFIRKDVGTGASGIWGQGGSRPDHYDWPALNLVGLVQDATHEADTGAFNVQAAYVVSGCRLKSADGYEKLKSAAASVTATTAGTPASLSAFRIGNASDGGYGQNDYASVLVYPSGMTNGDMDTIINWFGSATVFNLF